MRLLLFCILLFTAFSLQAQTNELSNQTKLFRSSNIFCLFSEDQSPLITSQFQLEKFISNTKGNSCDVKIAPEVDFEQNSLLVLSYRGVDCLSTFQHSMERNESEKEIIYQVKIYDGGCRAGGQHYTDWLLLPKVPLGYNFYVKTIAIEKFDDHIIWEDVSKNLN